MSRSRGELVLLGGVVLWAAGPVAVIVLHVLAHGGRLTGADGPISGDQLQYLAWIRDASRHALAANLFTLEAPHHVFAQPMFTLSGALTALGLPLALSYLLWKPVAVLVLWLGAARLMARAFPARPGQRWAALALGLLCLLPTAAVAGWAASPTSRTRAGLLTLGGELFPAGDLWGYLPSAVAIGVLPIALLAAERALTAAPGAVRRPVATAALAGALVAWLHPWQGVTLGLILLGLALWPPRGASAIRLLLPGLATALPLAYYELLARHDPAWHLASRNELAPHLPALALLVGLVPLLALAAAGLRRPDGSPFERALVLWVPAGLVTYFALRSYPAHGLGAISLPLAVLGVRGVARRRVPALVGAALVTLLIVPGLVYEVGQFADLAPASRELLYLNRSEARALDWLDRRAPPGGVLARTLFSLVVPAQTGRPVWVGHQFWSRDYARRSGLADALFAGWLTAPQARSLVRRSGARLLAADCATAPTVLAELRPVLAATHRFGCASVSVVTGPVAGGQPLAVRAGRRERRSEAVS